MYLCFFIIDNDRKKTNSKTLLPIKTTLVARQTVRLTEPTRLHRLKDAANFLSTFSADKYLVEVVPMVENKLCPSQGDCIDEAPRNNEIQCVPCNKLIVLLQVRYV